MVLERFVLCIQKLEKVQQALRLESRRLRKIISLGFDLGFVRHRGKYREVRIM